MLLGCGQVASRSRPPDVTHVPRSPRLSPNFYTASDKNLGIGKAGYEANSTVPLANSEFHLLLVPENRSQSVGTRLKLKRSMDNN